jgi:hypothetical protein
MSLTGLVARRGSIATVHHHVDTRSADGNSTRTYPTTTKSVGMLIEPITDELVRRVFGSDVNATFRALVPGLAPIAKDNGVTITGAARVGSRYRVTGMLVHTAGASPHRELALAETTEDFT